MYTQEDVEKFEKEYSEVMDYFYGYNQAHAPFSGYVGRGVFKEWSLEKFERKIGRRPKEPSLEDWVESQRKRIARLANKYSNS